MLLKWNVSSRMLSFTNNSVCKEKHLAKFCFCVSTQHQMINMIIEFLPHKSNMFSKIIEQVKFMNQVTAALCNMSYCISVKLTITLNSTHWNVLQRVKLQTRLVSFDLDWHINVNLRGHLILWRNPFFKPLSTIFNFYFSYVLQPGLCILLKKFLKFFLSYLL